MKDGDGTVEGGGSTFLPGKLMVARDRGGGTPREKGNGAADCCEFFPRGSGDRR